MTERVHVGLFLRPYKSHCYNNHYRSRPLLSTRVVDILLCVNVNSYFHFDLCTTTRFVARDPPIYHILILP